MSFKNASIIWKVASLLILLGLVSAAGAIYAANNMLALDGMYSRIIDGPSKASVQLSRAGRFTSDMAGAIYSNIAAFSDDDKKDAVAAQANAVKGFDTNMDDAASAVPAYGKGILALKADFHKALDDTCAEVVRIANQPPTMVSNAKASRLMMKQCEPAIRGVIQKMIVLNDLIRGDAERDSAAGSAQARVTIAFTLGGILGATLIITIIAVFLVRAFVVKPIRSMIGVMGAMGDGDLSREVTGTQRRDEVGAIAKALAVLRNQLGEAEAARRERAERAADERVMMERRESLAKTFVAQVQDLAARFTGASNEVAVAARNLSATAEETAFQAQAVASAAEEAATNVQTVAASAEELAVSIREITSQVTQSADVADVAFKEVEASNARIEELSSAATAIGDVINLIKGIADQTNLLALNATIEAARAGEAGRGFAVVASEVKELAAQTAKATSEISTKVGEIQQTTQGTVTSMGEIVRVVSNIKSTSTTIASAVEEQGSATGEIAHNCQQAADGTNRVTENIGGVGRAADATGSAAAQLLSLSQDLSGQAADLSRVVETFVEELKAAA
ncbi:methyl-accepting chemotaxis protein [Segnochrobactrum spirostomi]|uniref:HAMP domain-containing protein n=1 Tax=Segnochrobactrum spirostomi TaxID=2608987 RepID=A0A6A7Y3E7_9HYPH|nr:HAMP domain-containing methyl-accepting chemotaxis protein [Segnochrobactrum spirostomi]MQT12621.1 HAMP domain-containing protein [Segnochrobactrum spirostomi]